MDDMTLRADVALTRRGIAPTRAQAQAMMDAAKPAAPQAQSDNVSDLLNQLNF